MVEAVSIVNGSKGLFNQALAATHGIAAAIKKASQQVGVDFAYMLNKATQESGLDPNAKASTSSATGLYQFVDQTWLRMVKSHGDKYGLGAMADKINIGTDGVARVVDPAAKNAILALRKDPVVSAEMAAELTSENKIALQGSVGGAIGSTELYLAHFLGAGGASQFLTAMRNDPNAKAATILPEAASANQSVFYDKSGAPRSVAQIYKHFAEKFDHAPIMPQQDKTMVADASLSSHVMNGYSLAHDVISNYSSPMTFTAPSSGGQGGINDFKLEGNGSSTFATMVLAQMDMGSLSPMGRYNSEDNKDDQKKKSTLSTLAAVA